MSLVDRHVAFLHALRGAGLPVSLAEGLDAVDAVSVVGLADRDLLRTAYAATVVKRAAHQPAFDTLFDLWFPVAVGDGTPAPPAEVPDVPEVEVSGDHGYRSEVRELRAQLAGLLFAGDQAGLAQLARQAVGMLGRLAADGGGGGGSWSAMPVLDELSARTLLAGLMRAAAPDGELARRVTRQTMTARIDGFEQLVREDARRRIAEQRGPESVARWAVRPPIEQVDFLSATTAEISALRRELYPLARRLATRMAISHRHGRRGRLDFRRTIRRSLATGGVPVHTSYRPRRPHKPELVVLCDISSSVAAFARFAILLMYALDAQFTKVRTFVFVDRPTEVTGYFAGTSDVRDALSTMEGAGVRFMGSGTNYGRTFTEFRDRHADAIGPRTALLILGDARVNYLPRHPEVLTELVDRARHAYWLNPEPVNRWGTGDSAAHLYAELIEMVECRNLTQLAAFVEQLA